MHGVCMQTYPELVQAIVDDITSTGLRLEKDFIVKKRGDGAYICVVRFTSRKRKNIVTIWPGGMGKIRIIGSLKYDARNTFIDRDDLGTESFRNALREAYNATQ